MGREAVKRKLLNLFISRSIGGFMLSFFWQAAKLSLARHLLPDDIDIDRKNIKLRTQIRYRQNWKFCSQ